MRLNTQTGLIDQARFIKSPNHDHREHCSEPEAIIIHCISLPPGEYGGDQVCDFFCNQLNHSRHDYFKQLEGVEVSSHFFIRRDGQLTQFVPTHLRAWHAGESVCLGKSKVNDFSIGIELEGLDTDTQGFTEQQYKSLNSLIRELIANYPKITHQQIFAHSDIAPLRKPDPGFYFDWQKLVSV